RQLGCRPPAARHRRPAAAGHAVRLPRLPVAATLALGTRGARYDFETEVLLRAARRGMPLLGVPVDVYYPPVAERVSHFKPWRDTLRIIGTVVRVVVLPG